MAMKNKKLVSDIAIDGLFIALILVLSLVPYLGFIQIGGISATILPIPVILGAALLGPRRGVLYGAAFGFSSFLIAVIRGTAGDALFVDPLISIVPRILFGFCTAIFSAVSFNERTSFKLKRFLIFPYSAIMMLLHSFFVLLAMYLRYVNAFMEYIFPILTPLVLLEALVATVIVPVLYNVLYIPFEKYKDKFITKNKSIYGTITSVYFADALNSLKEFVSINSVYDEKTVTKKTPYGKGVNEALEYMKNLATNDGFEAKIIDGRVVEIFVGEKYNKNIAVFAHADVVPATGEWDTPPFTADIREGKLYGRGTSDDKGPAIAAYYAIKTLNDNNLLINYSVRLVIGGDEERGSSCMHYYFNEYNAPAPVHGFTPDAEFPLIYGEKGITNFTATKMIDLGPISTITGGEAANSVIDKVVIRLLKDEDFIKYLTDNKVEYTVKMLQKNMDVTLFGKSAHGSLPELGVNAGVLAFKHLGAFYKLPFLTHLAEKFKNPNGKTMDAYIATSLLGATTYNIGLLNYENGKLSFVVNFRYPENVEVETHLAKLAQTIDVELEIGRSSKHLLFDPKSEFIQTLLKAYRDETGDTQSKPLAIGGGTYAKECPNTVAFGSAFPSRSGDIHSANEHIYLDDFYTQMAIYARAIHYLGKKV